MTNQDLFLVIGIIVTGFSLPSLIGAFNDRRTPRVASISAIVGLGLILLAVAQRPGGYTLTEVPEAFVRVVAYIIR